MDYRNVLFYLGFGGANQTGTYIMYKAVSGHDIIMKNGHQQTINTLHHCITCMPVSLFDLFLLNNLVTNKIIFRNTRQSL